MTDSPLDPLPSQYIPKLRSDQLNSKAKQKRIDNDMEIIYNAFIIKVQETGRGPGPGEGER
jgi:hypothetical protein